MFSLFSYLFFIRPSNGKKVHVNTLPLDERRIRRHGNPERLFFFFLL